MEVKIRQVQEKDLEECWNIESSSYPASEAAPKERIKIRIKTYPQGFIIAELDGKVIGMINGASTNEDNIHNEKLWDMREHIENGKNIGIFSVAVLEEHRGKGISRLLMKKFIENSKKMNKEKILLFCKESMIKYYERYGFVYAGKSKAKWGESEWHDMYLKLN